VEIDLDDVVSNVETLKASNIDSCKEILNKTGCKVGLKLFHINIRSINCNFDELVVLLESLDLSFDLIILTETWGVQNTNIFNIEGYNIFYNSSNYNKSDGVVVYVKGGIPVDIVYNVIDNLTFTSMNFSVLGHTFTLLPLYRPPSYPESGFLEQLEAFLGVNSKSQINLLVGDINFDLLGNDRIPIQTYSNIMSSNGFISLINVPTRVTENSATCLDHIFLKSQNNTNISITPIVLETFVTDHFSTVLEINFERQLGKEVQFESTVARVDYEGLKRELKSENWETVYNSKDVDTAYNRFHNQLKHYIELCTSKIKIRSKNKKLKPWITAELIDSIKHRDKLKKRLRKFPGEQLETEYKEYRNNLTKLIAHTKFNYYRSKLLDAGKNTKKVWELIRDSIGDRKNTIQHIEVVCGGALVEEENSVANILNEYFINVGRSVADQIPPNASFVGLSSVPSKTISDSMFLEPVDNREICNIIASLRNNSAAGCDGISARIIKEIPNILVPPLVFIINMSFQSGKFPEDLKCSIVTPIFKGGDKHSPGNYRPISVTSQFSKIIEKAINTRLIKYFSRHSIISSRQFGFREGCSTEDALFSCFKYIYSSINDNKRTLAVFLDLAKAFDTVSHGLLLKKLENYGIRGVALELLKSYLTNREQIVKLGQTKSTSMVMKSGVPQGTVLGPLLFSVYVNDLLEGDIGGELIAYADDTAIVFSGRDWEEVKRKSEEGLSKVKVWLDKNLLALNVKKTSCVAFSPNAIGRPNFESITLHTCSPVGCLSSDNIKIVNELKYLGIVIDNHLR